MRIYFDVDFTLVGLDGTLRPGVKEIFAKIKEDGHQIFVWSGGRNPWTVVQDFSLWELVSDCYLKPTADHDNHMTLMSIPIPDFCVDDNKEIIDVFGGYWLPPYTYPEQPDDHIYRAYEAFKKHVEKAQKANGTLDSI